MQMGRNEPCFCGSGKKYKNCCLNKNEEIKAAAGQQQKYESAKSNVLMKLGDLMLSQQYKQDLFRAENVYFALRERKEEITDMERLGFYSWFVQDYLLEDNRYFIDHFCTDRMKYLDDLEKVLVQHMQEASQKIYEIKEVKQNEGLLFEEIYEKKQVFVHDAATANGSKVGDLISIRVIPVGEEQHPIGIGNYIPAGYKGLILDWIEEEFSKFKKVNDKASYEQFARKTSLRFLYFFERITQKKNKEEVQATAVQDQQETVFMQEDEIIGFLKQNMKRPYEEEEVEKACNLWVMYRIDQQEIKGKAEGFAAGVEYIINKQQNYGLTQSQIGEKYDVSASTVGKRYKDIVETLKIII